MTTSIPIFDGHNDVLLRLYKSTSSDVVSDFLGGEERGHIDLKKARAGIVRRRAVRDVLAVARRYRVVDAGR